MSIYFSSLIQTCMGTDLFILFALLYQLPLQILHVVMFEPLDLAARGH